MNTQTNIASNPAAHSLEDAMPFSFPAADHPAAETFDPAHFAEIVARRGELKTANELRFEARGGVVAVQSYCLMANDDIAIVRVGPRGGKRIIWNFGGGL